MTRRTLASIEPYQRWERLGLYENEWWAENLDEVSGELLWDVHIIGCVSWESAAKEAAEYCDAENGFDSDYMVFRLTGWKGQHHVAQCKAEMVREWNVSKHET